MKEKNADKQKNMAQDLNSDSKQDTLDSEYDIDADAEYIKLFEHTCGCEDPVDSSEDK